MHTFTVGQEYVRTHLLEFVGSKQTQSGVIWGNKEPGCLIITSGGRHGKKVGYSDEYIGDGCWQYFGQGQSGDHATSNAANKKLINGHHSILLFTTREPTASEIRERGNYQKLFTFQGEFNVSGYDIIIPDNGVRQGNKLLRFQLVPIGNSDLPLDDISNSPISGFDSLRKELIEEAESSPSIKKLTLAEYRYRSKKIRKYALLRAKNKCEACSFPPPFIDMQGNGFLEVHHILRMADDGIDSPQNVIAICPNCHRRAHYSKDRDQFQQYLLSKVLQIENTLGAF